MRIPVNIRIRDVALFHLGGFFESAMVKRIASSSLLILGIVAFNTGDGEGFAVRLALIGVVLGGVLVFFLLIFLLILGMIVSNGKENGEFGQMIYVLDANGLRIERSSDVKSYSWPRINDAGRSSRSIWFHIDEKQYRIFPRHSLSTEVEFEQVWKLVSGFRTAA